MKKYLFLAAVAFGAATMSSCNREECCTLLTVKECEGEEPSGLTWDEYKAQLDAVGYNCD
jgi:hypothetical protein